MITDSMALQWTAGIPPWVLTRASRTQTLWSICWLSLGAHNPVVNIWPGACCRMISGLNWKVNFRKCLAPFIGLAFADAQFLWCSTSFGLKNGHWLWLMIFGCSLVCCLFLWCQYYLSLALGREAKQMHIYFMTKHTMLLFSKRERERERGQTIKSLHWPQCRFTEA